MSKILKSTLSAKGSKNLIFITGLKGFGKALTVIADGTITLPSSELSQ